MSKVHVESPISPTRYPAEGHKVEEVPCPLCGQQDPETGFRVWDRLGADRHRQWTIVRCRSCKVLYLNPRPTPESLSTFYKVEGYDPFAGAVSQVSLWERSYGLARRLALRWKRRLIERYVRPGRLLDVGCGTGEFLAFMKGAGWQVQGIEADPRAARHARERLGVPVDVAGVEAMETLARTWDAITFWHVLEHLPDPVEVLRQAASRLTAEGIVIVAVPNAEGLDARFYGDRWAAWDAPRHLVHFGPATLDRAIADAALLRVDRRPMPLDAFYHCLLSERGDPDAPGVLKWLRGLAVAKASWLLDHVPPNAGTRGSSLLVVLRPKGRGGK